MVDDPNSALIELTRSNGVASTLTGSCLTTGTGSFTSKSSSSENTEFNFFGNNTDQTGQKLQRWLRKDI